MHFFRSLFKQSPKVAEDPTISPEVTERASVRAARQEAERAEGRRLSPGVFGERKIYQPNRKITLKRGVPDPTSTIWPSGGSHLDRK